MLQYRFDVPQMYHLYSLVLFDALQLEVELSRQRHDGDLREKNRLTRMLDNKVSWFLTDLSTLLPVENCFLSVLCMCIPGLL